MLDSAIAKNSPNAGMRDSNRNAGDHKTISRKVEFSCRDAPTETLAASLSAEPPEASLSIAPHPGGRGPAPPAAGRASSAARAGLRVRSGWRRAGGRGRGRTGGGRLRIASRLDRIVLDLLFHRAQSGDVLLMLIVGFGKTVPAGS